MRAREISPLALDSYQRAARVILSNHLVTQTYPDRIALPLLRRWATELRDDLLDAVRLPARGHRDDGPAVHGDRPTRRRRRRRETGHRPHLRPPPLRLPRAVHSPPWAAPGNQITLSELADHVAADAAQVDGVDLSTERASDRDAFVDAVGWLAARGAITLADGDAGGWAANPERARRCTTSTAPSSSPCSGRRAHCSTSPRSADCLPGPKVGGRRGTTDFDPTGPRPGRRRGGCAGRWSNGPWSTPPNSTTRTGYSSALPRTAADVELLTGLVAERRAEGVALIDTSGRLSDVRFPEHGHGRAGRAPAPGRRDRRSRARPGSAGPARCGCPLPARSATTSSSSSTAPFPQSGIFDEPARGHDYAETRRTGRPRSDRLFPVGRGRAGSPARSTDTDPTGSGGRSPPVAGDPDGLRHAPHSACCGSG